MFRPLGPITSIVRRGALPEAFGACGPRGPLACTSPVTTSRAIVGPGDRDRSVWNGAGTTVTIVFFRETLYSPPLGRWSQLCFHAKGSNSSPLGLCASGAHRGGRAMERVSVSGGLSGGRREDGA